MNSLQFWKNWQKSSRNLYIFSLSILLFSILTLSFFYIKGLENVVHWDILSELGEVPIILDQFKVGSETLSLPTKTFTVTEQFVASPMAINFIGNYVFLGLLSFAFVLLLSALSALPRFWYLISMGLVIVFLATLNTELLYYVSNKYFTMALIMLFVGLSYFFHAFRPDIDIAKRFICFFTLTILIAIAIFFTAKVTLPFLLLASYRTAGAMLLSTAFIFLVAYEIVNGFLIISTSVKSTQSLQNFLLISLIYLVNVLLIFLHNNKIIDWEMIYLSPFLLIVLSSVLGIWGFKKRTESLFGWLNFEKSGAFIYLSLAIFTIATCALAFATSNDPMIEVMEDAITYTHLAMGLMFLLYVLLNFFPLFKQAFEVHKVVFKPLRLPIWTFRVLAIILIAALLVLKGFFTLQQAFAAHYNALGDYYTADTDYVFAEIEYKSALTYEYQNHKTNYALASLALLQGDNETAAVYFRNSLAKSPSVFAYEGLSRSFYDGEHFFDAMFTLKEGLQKFPKSGELQNNLAYLFNKSNIQDSTVLYYEMAVKNAFKSEVPASNLLAFWANNGKKTAIEELLQQTEDIQHNSYQANKLAMKNIVEKKFSEPADNDFIIDLSPDSVLSASNFAWIYNQTFYQKALGENFDLRRFSELEENESLSEDLLFANIIQEYYKGDKLLTFQNLQAWAVGDSTDKKGKYYQLLLNTFLKKEAVEKVNLAEIQDVIGVGLKQHPLNEAIVSKAVELLNKNRQPEKAYQVVLNAISWRKNSPILYQLYIQQALTIGMKAYAEDGMKALQKLSPTDYQRFLPTYQAKLASIEKASAGFQ